MVKKFAAIFYLLSIGIFCQDQIPTIASDHIRIDHIGPHDKPIISLVISTTKLKFQVEEEEILVSESVFFLFPKCLKDEKNLAFEKEKNEFGGVYNNRIDQT